MHIQPIGSYLTVDEQGYIVNPASIDKLQEKWIPIIEEIKQAYINHYGGCLMSVYIRGSVAKGKAIENISDVDSMAIIAGSEEPRRPDWLPAFEAQLIKSYPYIDGVEIALIPFDNLSQQKPDQILLKTQSVCVYGEDIAKDIPLFKPGRDTAQHVKSIEQNIAKTKKILQDSELPEEKVQQWCRWIMKRLLRTGFELVMERSQKYTRDLYPCYEGFSEYYPEQKEKMYHVLELAINPTPNATEVVTILDDIGAWIIDEIQKQKLV